ncbi:unnamed protein product [Mytilus coruscus]|uniref:Ig-like domain-containing protein n=1 Tax=Mytilus coruscus TaxID=42192 RepID=A0A6J8BLU3_MYTCO|nr:unnamed protein product [Mytilus coruscus]
MTWFYDKKFIALGKMINPEFGQRFSISRYVKVRKYNLQITNFTDGDQGRYRCQGVYGGKYKQHKVTVKICDLPNEISAFKTVLNLHVGKKEIYKMNHVCNEEDNLDQLQTTSSKQIPTLTVLNEAATKQNTVTLNKREENQTALQKYACLQTNNENCVTSNCTFLNVEWRSSHENAGAFEYSRQNVRQDLELYICYFNTSNVVEDVQYPSKIKLYRANTILYFQNFNIISAGYYHCLFNQIDGLETATLSDDKINGQLATANVPSPVERTTSVEDESQFRVPAVPDYLEITDSVNPHSVEMTNYSLDITHTTNSTYSGSLSSDYESIDSRSGNTDTLHEQDVVLVDRTNRSTTNNSIERGINLDIHLYVNTNIMNPYEQLKNQTRDIHTYTDLNDGF